MKKRIGLTSLFVGILAFSLFACTEETKKNERPSKINNVSLKENSSSTIITPMSYNEILSCCSGSLSENIAIVIKGQEEISEEAIINHMYLLRDDYGYFRGEEIPYHDDLHIDLMNNVDGFATGVMKASFGMNSDGN